MKVSILLIIIALVQGCAVSASQSTAAERVHIAAVVDFLEACIKAPTHELCSETNLAEIMEDFDASIASIERATRKRTTVVYRSRNSGSSDGYRNMVEDLDRMQRNNADFMRDAQRRASQGCAFTGQVC